MPTAAERRIELEEMTKAQLVAIGLGHDTPIELDPNVKKGDMVDQLLKAEGFNPAESAPTENSAAAEIRAKDLPPVGRLFELPHASGKKDAAGKDVLDQPKQWAGRMYRLTIHDTENEHGPVDITVNGHNYRINRGVSVTVPEPVINVLRDAVVHTFRRDPESNQVTPYKYQRFPHQAEALS